MKYYVKFRVEARYVAEIEADNIEEAKRAAEDAFSGADFGEAEDIDGDIVTVEDEDGNFLEEE